MWLGAFTCAIHDKGDRPLFQLLYRSDSPSRVRPSCLGGVIRCAGGRVHVQFDTGEVFSTKGISMNTTKKIQLLAILIVTNGIGALALIDATPVLAATCNPVQICIGFANCNSLTQAQRNNGCQSAAPGCSVKSATCVPTPFCTPSSSGGLFCQYN